MKTKGRWRKWHAVFAISKGEAAEGQEPQLKVKQATKWERSKDKLVRTMRRLYRESKGTIELVIRTQKFHEKPAAPNWSDEAVSEARKFMRLHRCALPEAQSKLLADPDYRKGLALAMEVLGDQPESFQPTVVDV